MQRSYGFGRCVMIGAASTITCLSTTTAASPLDGLYELEEQISIAQEAYLEAIGEHHHDGDGAPHVPTPKVADDREPLLKKIDALAAANEGSEDGAAMALSAFYWSWNYDIDLPGLHRRFVRITQHYADDPRVDVMF